LQLRLDLHRRPPRCACCPLLIFATSQPVPGFAILYATLGFEELPRDRDICLPATDDAALHDLTDPLVLIATAVNLFPCPLKLLTPARSEFDVFPLALFASFQKKIRCSRRSFYCFVSVLSCRVNCFVFFVFTVWGNLTARNGESTC